MKNTQAGKAKKFRTFLSKYRKAFTGGQTQDLEIQMFLYHICNKEGNLYSRIVPL